MKLTVVIRDDDPMYNYNSSPTYRSVQLSLTEEQVKAIEFKHDGESIAQSFLEEEGDQ